MDKGKSPSEVRSEYVKGVPFKRVNLKLDVEVHRRLRKKCREEGVTVQRKVAFLVRQFVGLSK